MAAKWFNSLDTNSNEGASEEENSGDDENPSSGNPKKKKDKNVKSRNKGCFQLETPNDTEDGAMKEEFKKEQEELQVIATEKKNDDIWSGKSYFLISHLLIFSPHY